MSPGSLHARALFRCYLSGRELVVGVIVYVRSSYGEAIFTASAESDAAKCCVIYRNLLGELLMIRVSFLQL